MAKCKYLMKVWTLRGATFLIGVLSVLCSLVLISYFVDLFVRDLHRYTEGSVYFSYVDQRKSFESVWSSLSQEIKALVAKLCFKFNKKNAPAKSRKFVESAATGSFPFEKPPRGPWSLAPRLPLGPTTSSTASLSDFITVASAKNLANESASWPWTADLNATAILSGSAPPKTAGPRQKSLLSAKSTSYPYFLVLIGNGTIKYKVLHGRDYWGLAAYSMDRPTFTPDVRSKNDRDLETPGKLPWRARKADAKCVDLEKEYFDPLNTSVGIVRLYFVQSAEGNLHIVFMTLDLTLVFLSTLFCIASYILAVGARRKNRVFLIPWICISGVCIYGSILFALWHIAEENGLVSLFTEGIPPWEIVFMFAALAFHALSIFVVDLFLRQLVIRDRDFEE